MNVNVRKVAFNFKCDGNAVKFASDVSKLLRDIEKEVTERPGETKECQGLLKLKEKCCSCNVALASTAYNGIARLVENKILAPSQAVTFLISLLPSSSRCSPLTSTMGKILLFHLKEESAKSKSSVAHNQHLNLFKDVHHPFILILKCNGNESWFEVFLFISSLMESHNEINASLKINLISPVFYYTLGTSAWTGTQFQEKLFNCLSRSIVNPKYVDFVLEILAWKKVDIQFCLFLKDIFASLLSDDMSSEFNELVSALTPYLAVAIKWIILNGHNPSSFIILLNTVTQFDNSSLSIALCILTDVILETSLPHVLQLASLCKSIICSASCNAYIAARFAAVSLGWFTDPTQCAGSLYKVLEEILSFLENSSDARDWNDTTTQLTNNKYFRIVTNSDKSDIIFALDMISNSNLWCYDRELLDKWLTNLKLSNELNIQLRLHTLIHGIILRDNKRNTIELCLKIIVKLLDVCKEISFGHLCLIYYKIARETDPHLLKTYLLHLPQLAVDKGNIPFIINIIESLKGGKPKVLSPLIIQLFLLLWKSENRTYTYLHRSLHESRSSGFDVELNLSKAIALRDICREAPHLHAKDVISVLNRVLNDCSGRGSGAPSAIALEAIIYLCQAYVIDPLGTWNAVQPALSIDKRPKVVKTLCNFFGEIPKLNSSAMKNDVFIKNVLTTLWHYTLMDDSNIVAHAFKALANFEVENMEMELLPEEYWSDGNREKSDKEQLKNARTGPFEGLSAGTPPNSWAILLEKLDDSNLDEGVMFLAAIIERELNSLPRGLFHLPPQKQEPSTSPGTSTTIFARRIIRVMSRHYSKPFPPLDWHFLSGFVASDPESLPHSLALLMKQGPTSDSAKSMFEDFISATDWSREKIDVVVSLFEEVPKLCGTLSYNVFRDFLKKTLNLCLQMHLEEKGKYFEKIMFHLTESFRQENISSSYKNAVASLLEEILPFVPADHEVMNVYASCVTELPLTTIDKISSVKSIGCFENVDSCRINRAILIRHRLATSSVTVSPMTWFDEMVDAVAASDGLSPHHHGFLLHKILESLRSRRDCNHSSWLQGVMSKISRSECSQAALSFLLDLFIGSIIVLSGFDIFFLDLQNVMTEFKKKLHIFPMCCYTFFNSSEWPDSVSKISNWFQKLVKWHHLPQIYAPTFGQCILFLGNYEENQTINYIKLASSKAGTDIHEQSYGYGIF